MMLNQAQQEAVGHKDGPMLVLAGPGSGKTLVITERTKYLINKHKISEGNILVITFTRAASKEMKDRFLKTMKRSKTAVNFGTFHSVFFTILKYAYNLSVNNIIKDDERINCIKSIINKMGISYDDEKEFIAEILSEISMVKAIG